MVPSCDNQLHVGQFLRDFSKRLNHEFQALVRSPLAERKNPMVGVTATGKFWKLRPSGENSVRPEINILSPIFFVQNLSIAWHQNRNRIRQQKHSGGYRSCRPIHVFETHTRVLQFNRIHQVVQGHMGIIAAQTGQYGRHQPRKSNHGIASKSAEQQIEPNHVRLPSS